MRASFRGVCRVCEGIIKTGTDEIVRDDSGSWIDVRCADGYSELP